ncbi:MAG: DUF4390 domain-containing protein [Acidobacteriota bacterium]
MGIGAGDARGRRGRGRADVRGALLAAILAVFVTAPSPRAEGPLVKDLRWAFENNAVVVSFGVADALEREDLREAVLSTAPVTLTFTAEVVKSRSLWKNKTVGRKVVRHTVRYDNLTRQFSVETVVDGLLADQRVLATWEEMAAYMGRVEGLAVTSVANLEPSEGGYLLRVSVHVLSDFVLWIIPWSVETPWVSTPLPTP